MKTQCSYTGNSLHRKEMSSGRVVQQFKVPNYTFVAQMLSAVYQNYGLLLSYLLDSYL